MNVAGSLVAQSDAKVGYDPEITYGLLEGYRAPDLTTINYGAFMWLSVAIGASFSVLAIPRAVHLLRSPSKVRPPAALLVAKLAAGIVLAGLRLGILISTVGESAHGSEWMVAAASLDFAASGLLLVLSPLEHFKSPRPSTLLCSYLLMRLLCDIGRYVLVWASLSTEKGAGGTDAILEGLVTAATAMEFIFLVLESLRRMRWVNWNPADHSPEEISGILSLGLYAWVNPLLWQGHHKPLTMKQLYALDSAISVRKIREHHVTSSSKHSGGTSTWDILLWLAKPLGSSVLLAIVPRLFLLGFTFCQPFFLQSLLKALSDGNAGSEVASIFITVAVVTYTGIAISTSLYWYYQERFQSLLRGFLISAIYKKTLQVSHVGDGDSASVTLMGADVERVYTGVRYLHEVWVNLIQIALASWLLQRELGVAFLAPLVIVVMAFTGTFILSGSAVKFQTAWMARVQARIAVTSTVLSRIKDLRISGMTNPAADLVQHEREDEIQVGERSRVLVATTASISLLPQAIAPALAFAFGPQSLDIARAYTALSYLSLLTAPLMVTLQVVPILAACLACLTRIKTYLTKQERFDNRSFDKKSEHGEYIDGSDAEVKASIIIQDGTFGWKADTPVLKDINMKLPKSSITFVIGPVASGKTTLCRALLGEVPQAQGTISLISDKLGYCDQSPFLFNASIIENIVGYSSFDAVRYDDVIQATMLVEDLRVLPEGDSTVIGSKGISLSGGQRQRVALARALYQATDILVLDDVFSGLDGTTQQLVCRAVFGRNGLLRRRGTTALVCTHSTQLLSVADFLVSLSMEGTITDQGRLVEIIEDEERARHFGLSSSAHEAAYDLVGETSKPTIEMIKATVNEAISNQLPFSVPSRKTQGQPEASPTVDLEVYRHWLSTIGAVPLALYVVFVIGIGFTSNFPTVWLKLWSQDSVLLNPHHPFVFWIGIYTLLGVGNILCVFPAGIIMLRTMVRNAGTDLHHAAVKTIMHSSLQFLGNTDVGKVLNLFSQDMNIMDTQLPRMVNNLCICLATAIGQVAVIALSSAWLIISYPFFVALLWLVQLVYLPSSKRLRILDLEAKTPLYTNFLDTLGGLPTIRAFGWSSQTLDKNNNLLDESQRPSYLLAMAQQWLTLTMNLIVAIIAIVLVVLATQLRSDAGSVGAGLVTLISLGGTLTTIVIAYTGLETSLGAISRLKSFEDETEQEGSTEHDLVPDAQWPTSGYVQMKGIEASYDGTEKVLKELDLVVVARQKVAICGRTGSGKSSILSLLLRLIDPLPPTDIDNLDPSIRGISIDGLSLDDVDRTVLRERIICSSQDPVFLPDGTSFRQNLDPWAAASDHECIAVLSDVDLATVIDASGGLDGPMSASGLSAGQKQLFNLARTVLRRRVKQRLTGVDGGLLLLDEITSNADAETEKRVQSILDEDFAAYTVIMVTHRREMAMACDRVVLLDAGRIVEDGSPNDLLHKDGGRFKGLWAAQESS